MDTLTLAFLRVGHSHEDIDQFLGMLTTILNGNPSLEDPSDVVLPGPWCGG